MYCMAIWNLKFEWDLFLNLFPLLCFVLCPVVSFRMVEILFFVLMLKSLDCLAMSYRYEFVFWDKNFHLNGFTVRIMRFSTFIVFIHFILSFVWLQKVLQCSPNVYKQIRVFTHSDIIIQSFQFKPFLQPLCFNCDN